MQKKGSSLLDLRGSKDIPTLSSSPSTSGPFSTSLGAATEGGPTPTSHSPPPPLNNNISSSNGLTNPTMTGSALAGTLLSGTPNGGVPSSNEEDWTTSSVVPTMNAGPPGSSMVVKKKPLLDKYEKVLWTRKIDGPCLIQHTLPFEKERCALWHSNEDRRRDPRRQGPQGPISRAPWIYSNHHAEGGTLNYVELAYHPQNFKTLKCNEFASTGKCPRFEYCPRRHIYNGVDYDADYVPPPLLPILPESEFRKLMSSYKVQGPCPLKCDLVPTNKPPWLHCPYFHGKIETSIDIRRALQVNKETGEWIPTLKAATSKLEYSYHPERFKMEPCLHFNTKGYCAREYTCSFYHGEEEYYKIGEYFERLKNDLLTKGKIEIYEDPPLEVETSGLSHPVGNEGPDMGMPMNNMAGHHMGNMGLVDEFSSDYPGSLLHQTMNNGAGGYDHINQNTMENMHPMMLNNMMMHPSYNSNSPHSHHPNMNSHMANHVAGMNITPQQHHHQMNNSHTSPIVSPKNSGSRLLMNNYGGVAGMNEGGNYPNNPAMVYMDQHVMYNQSNSNLGHHNPGSFYGANNGGNSNMGNNMNMNMGGGYGGGNMMNNASGFAPAHSKAFSNSSGNINNGHANMASANNGSMNNAGYNINSVPNIYTHLGGSSSSSAGPLSSSASRDSNSNYYTNFGSNLFDVFSSGGTNYSQFYPSTSGPVPSTRESLSNSLDYSSPSLRAPAPLGRASPPSTGPSLSPESRSPPLGLTSNTSPIPITPPVGLTSSVENSNQGSPLYSLLLECGIPPDKGLLYSRLLLDHDIDSHMLLSNTGEINYSTLEKVGITSVGHQIKIMRLGRLGRLGSSAPGSDISADFQKMSLAAESGYPSSSAPILGSSPAVAPTGAKEEDSNGLVFNKQQPVGENQYSILYKGLLNNSSVSIKKLKKGYKYKENLDDYVNNLAKLRHTHLLLFFGLQEAEGISYLVTEYVDNNATLESVLIHQKRNVGTSNLSLKSLLTMASQVTVAMQYLVEQQVIHGDLCAANIMVGSNFSIKVCDYGISQMIATNSPNPNDSEDDPLLRYSHAPIEVLQQRHWILEASDVWSFGVLLWEMFEPGTDPYLGIPNEEIHLFLESGQRLPQPDHCPQALYHTMLKCWQLESSSRLSFSSLRVELNLMVAFDTEEGKNMSPVYRNNQDYNPASLWDE